MKECIILEIQLNGKSLILCTLYRSPSQSSEEFDIFMQNFESDLGCIADKNPYLIVILGDFNAKSSNWCSNDVTTQEGFQIDALTSYYNLQQIISEPTHILPHSNSCIDLIFTSQPNLVRNSGVLASLHSNCHHNIIFVKFDLNIEYPPLYKRLVWIYDKANSIMIQRAASQFDWEKAFSNQSIDSKIEIFNEVLLNIFSNYCPSKKITCNDNEPPWLTDKIKRMICLKDDAFKHFQSRNEDGTQNDIYKILTQQITDEIEKEKHNYYDKLSNKLNDPSANQKKYWTVLKTLMNDKKTPLIPPILIDDTFVSDFQEKAELFNNYFADQCCPIENRSQIPDTVEVITDTFLHNVEFTSNDVLNIIKSLNINKAHGYDNISIRMLKLFGESICKPLELIFQSCLQLGVFPDLWKKANIISIHKKSLKKLLKNYRPVSLLPICSKIFERLIFNSIYNYLHKNKLLHPNQSGFKPGDSCTNQLISITHMIYSSLNHTNSHEVRGIFLDMSKAFDKVWHKGLLYKIKTFGVSSNIFYVLQSFLSNRFQRVALYGI